VEDDHVLSKELESPLQSSNLEEGGYVFRTANSPQDPSGTNVELKRASFDSIASWAPASKLAHGGRDSRRI
jgi:hypothetical protein